MRKKIQEAIAKVEGDFPFPEYISTLKHAIENIVGVISSHLEKGSRILDFGSGPCDKTAVVQSFGYKCSAYDDLADEWHTKEDNLSQILDFAKRHGVDFKLAQGEALPFEKNSFDMVMAHDVLEHLHDSPRIILNDLCELLVPNGLLFITVPSAVNVRKRINVLFGKTNLPPYNSFYWYPGPWRGHVREYCRNDLVLLARYLKLEVLELRSCHHMIERIPKIFRPFYLLATKAFPGWRDTWLLVAKKPKDWKSQKEVSDEQLKLILSGSPYYGNS